MSGLLATITLSPFVGWLPLSEFAAITLYALWDRPGAPWATPIGLALAGGVLCWVVARWPWRLLALLHARYAEALAELRAQRRMVATLFHDLANPLQAVIAGVELASDEEPLDKSIVTYASRMAEILAASQRSHPVVSVREARALCDDLAVMFRDQLAKKRIRLNVACPPAAKIACDESQLRDSVLANLLSNAIKFSPAGSEIELGVEEDAAQTILRVADRGPGLPDDVRAAIALGRLAPSQHGSAGELGTGYGLLLAREYIAAMGGTLDFRPRDGGGLSARITLPRLGNHP
jgi:two-component system sensor histidine kinase KdpD